jgi:hypothetical protein
MKKSNSHHRLGTVTPKEKGRVASAAQSKRNARDSANDSRSWVIARVAEHDRLAKLRAPFVTTPLAKRQRLLRLLSGAEGNATATQRERALRALRIGPITTHELRQYLDIVQPTTRIHELRQMGHNIVTRWCKQESACGRRVHRFALYTLVAGKAAA